MKLKKNMKLGNKYNLFLVLFFLFGNEVSFTDDKITSSPLINLEKIKPSFDELNNDVELSPTGQNIKNFSHVVLIGLDKITAKSSHLVVNLNEVKKFGPLEIKILKCGKVQVDNKLDEVAYMQVKDLTKNENEKVFIFNGWTFASDPGLTPFDHAIYDLQLLSCFNA
jgi:hypothetical protein